MTHAKKVGSVYTVSLWDVLKLAGLEGVHPDNVWHAETSTEWVPTPGKREPGYHEYGLRLFVEEDTPGDSGASLTALASDPAPSGPGERGG